MNQTTPLKRTIHGSLSKNATFTSSYSLIHSAYASKSKREKTITSILSLLQDWREGLKELNVLKLTKTVLFLSSHMLYQLKQNNCFLALTDHPKPSFILDFQFPPLHKIRSL